MPPRRPNSPQRAILYFGLFVIVWWFLPFGIKLLQKRVFAEFQAPSLAGMSYLRDLQDYWVARAHTRSQLIELGMNLARLNAAYELRNQEFRHLENEVQRLEQILNLERPEGFRFEVARVAQRELNSWWHILILRKGSFHGIAPGQAVVFSGGVVGRIRDVHTYTSTVELISNRGFRVAAHIQGDTRPLQFQGAAMDGLAKPVGRVSNVPSDVRVASGGRVRLVSSSLGGSFPDGLTLGWVYYLETEPNGLFRIGDVILDERLLGLREVAVLIPIQPEN